MENYESSKEDVDEDEEETDMDEKINLFSKFDKDTCCLIHPDSNLRAIIDTATFLLILTISLYIPFVFSFSIESEEFS